MSGLNAVQNSNTARFFQTGASSEASGGNLGAGGLGHSRNVVAARKFLTYRWTLNVLLRPSPTEAIPNWYVLSFIATHTCLVEEIIHEYTVFWNVLSWQ